VTGLPILHHQLRDQDVHVLHRCISNIIAWIASMATMDNHQVRECRTQDAVFLHGMA
jgi:hypothetical protein